MSTICTGCEKKIREQMIHEDDDCNPFCEECWEALQPVMKADYEELKRKGEID